MGYAKINESLLDVNAFPLIHSLFLQAIKGRFNHHVAHERNKNIPSMIETFEMMNCGTNGVIFFFFKKLFCSVVEYI